MSAAVEYAIYPFDLPTLREVARGAWLRLWHDARVKILARRGIERQSARDENREDPMDKLIGTMDENWMAGLLVEISVGVQYSRLGTDAGILDLALMRVPEKEKKELEAAAKLGVKVKFDAKRKRIDKAEAAKNLKVPKPVKKGKPDVQAKKPAPAKKTKSSGKAGKGKK